MKIIKYIFLLIIIVTSSFNLYSQNVGQQGDTLKNYIDINGMRQGYWEKKYPNGKIKYQAHFKNNIPVGEFKRYYENGQLFAHIFYDMEGKGNGDATYYWDDGKLLAKGRLVNVKQKQGLWKVYNTKGVLLQTINFDKGIKNGEQITYYHEGGVAERVFYLNGKRNGKMTQYFPDGKIKLEMNYKNGAFDGDVVAYYPDGKIKLKGYYRNDLKDGKWVFYDETGKIERSLTYDNGKLVSEDKLAEQLKKDIEDIEKNPHKYKTGDPDEDDFFNPGFRPKQRNRSRNNSFEEY